jgi:putative ABC transport system ATP-binding protein
MNILGCLDRPTGGTYELSGSPTHKMGAARLASVRNREIGFVFQSFELLPRATALRNVMLPLIYSPRNWRGAKARAKRALERVGLGERMRHRPNQLSGGQRQRVAIARALVNEPSMILADEPTGNLDTASTLDVLSLFTELNQQGRTVVLITHEREVARQTARVVLIRDGHLYQSPQWAHDAVGEELAATEALSSLESSQGSQPTSAATRIPLWQHPEEQP